MSPLKVVICGGGFLGRHIAKAISCTQGLDAKLCPQVQISSRNPAKLYEILRADKDIPKGRLSPAIPVDITKPSTIETAFQDASVVISLVGIMHGSPQDFENIQWKGAENVAKVATDVGAKLIHFSAIGADPESCISYARTKGLAERSIMKIDPFSTIIRPSLVFGPEDDFFNRFAKLSRFLPFLPVFGGGTSLFQPVYVGDIARFVAKLCTDDPKSDIVKQFEGKTVEAGGPGIFTYRELMKLVLDTTGRKRPIVSLPFAIGMLQGTILEKLPVNLFTVTRAQVEQLRSDNIVNRSLPMNHMSLEGAMSNLSMAPLHTVHEILPTYLR